MRKASHFPLSLAAGITTFQIAGYLAMPASVAVTGQAVQLYHFRDAARTIVASSAALCLALTLTSLAVRQTIQPVLRRRSVSLAMAFGGLALLVLPILRNQANARRHLETDGPVRLVGSEPPTWAVSYRRDWETLARELLRPEFHDARVLATVDNDLYAWWTGLHGRETFLAHAFVSALPDRTLLQRLTAFGHLQQLAPAEFLSWVTTRSYTTPFSQWFACARYSANALRAYAATEDYTPEQRRTIAAVTDPLDCWHLPIPRSELRMFERVFADFADPDTWPTPLPDLIILTEEFPQLRPDSCLFTLVYRNPTFRVFQRMHAP